MEQCMFCGEPGQKARVQVRPWKYVCVYICAECKPRFNEAVTAVRADHEQKHGR